MYIEKINQPTDVKNLNSEQLLFLFSYLRQQGHKQSSKQLEQFSYRFLFVAALPGRSGL